MANRKATPGTVDEAREVIAELHGVLKDVKTERAALAADYKKVAALRNQLAKDYEKELAQFILEKGKEVRELVVKEADEIQEMFDEAKAASRQHLSEILGAESPEDLIKSLRDSMTKVLQAKLDTELEGLRDWVVMQTNHVIKQSLKGVKVQLRDLPR